MLAHKIDANGYMLDPVMVDDSFVNTADTIVDRCPDGFYKPQWNGTQWVEGATSQSLLQQAQSQQLSQIQSSYISHLNNGFTSSATGTTYTYGFTDDDRRNMGDELNIINAGVATSPIPYGIKGGQTIVDHTISQFKQVASDAANFRWGAISKLRTKSQQIEACKTITDAQSIVWNDTAPPSIPTGFVGTNVSGNVTFTWNQNPEIDVQIDGQYNLYKNGTKVNSFTSTSGNVSGLASGTYSFTLSASDSDGNESPQCNAITINV